MKTENIYARLAEIAPSVCFDAARCRDDSFEWDFEDPDPKDEGYYPFDVEVRARAILGGEVIEATQGLGGSYYRPDEPLGDIHGYLPQMLEEVATELLALCLVTGTPIEIQTQLANAIAFLKTELRDRYAEQMATHN